MVRWSVQPLIPTSLWLALATAALALLLWYAWRRPAVVTRSRWAGIISLMTLAIAGVLGLLLNPIRIEEIPPPAGKPLLTVLVDATASMKTPDIDGASRYAAAVKAAEKLSDRLADRFDVRMRMFTESASPTDVKALREHPPTGQSTNLAAAIAGCLEEDRPQGQAIALLSDGGDNARDESGAHETSRVRDAARLARAMASPIYAKTFGSTAGGGFDLGVEVPSPQDIALIGQQVLVTANITHIGLSGAHPNVMLLQNGKEVGRVQADLLEGRTGEVHFWVSQQKPGVYPYEVRVESLPGEMTLANNIGSYLLRVVDEPIRVLQVEGKPYWDSKFLMRTLSSAPAVELDSAVRISDERIMWRTVRRGGEEGATSRPSGAPPASAPAGDPASKQRTEKWKVLNNPAELLGDAKFLARYQVVVVGRDAEVFLTDAALLNLQNWVLHSSGALVCYRGSPTAQTNERLARLLPVRWTPSPEARFHMTMTSEGRNQHWFNDTAGDMGAEALRRLPTLASTAQPQRSKPLALVLANSVSPAGEGSPAVIYQPYGSGRVVVIEGAGMWRWAFLPPQFQKQEEIYRTLWHSMLRWLVADTGLMAGQKMMLRSRELTFSPDEPAGVMLLLREDVARGQPPMIELKPDAGGPPKTFAPVSLREDPTAFNVDFGKLPEGHYEARIVGAGAKDSFSKIMFDVRHKGEEELDIKAQPELMQRIADDSGGAVLGADVAGDVATGFAEHMARIRPPRSQRTTAWDKWWILAGIIGLWGASWWLRRSGGLI